MPTVQMEIRNRVAIVTIDRPEVRNAVDRATAEALADAFREVDANNSLDVAILTGAGGNFCAGADLKALAAGEGNRMSEDGDGPMGPTRMLLSKPVIAAVEGYAVAGGLELRVVVRSSRVAGIERDLRRLLPTLRSASGRSRHDSPPRASIGQSRAMDLILAGRAVSGDDSVDDGLGESCLRAGTSARYCHRACGIPQHTPAELHALRSPVGLRTVVARLGLRNAQRIPQGKGSGSQRRNRPWRHQIHRRRRSPWRRQVRRDSMESALVGAIADFR